MVKIINSLSLPDDKNKPKIEFPCKYPIKILGKSNENFIPDVLDIVSKFSSSFDHKSASSKKKRRHILLFNIVIDATGKK